MYIISLLFQNILIILFLSTSFSKIFNFSNHINYVESYRIPIKISKKLIISFLLVIEIFISISFIFNLNYFLTIFISIALLTLYSLVALFHLRTSEDSINCGCGGVLNSDTLSFDTVYRNLILILFLVLMFVFPHPIDDFFYTLPFSMIGLLLALAYYLLIEYRNRFKEITILHKENI
ncbi:MauE/DoxX family redox-associated membrane protein [Psychrobacillus sp. NPDC058041]|uniref:MauE/DoxX family redox-associated membrane protein n=1 Tax=Psychrobacillus sp. NPDC058041 TaxID=3346310 RepID=UPI0036D866DB